ncbi:MAG: anaerobic ribonucleoside-triphosphate reductase [Promethearchaeota archaeon]
MHLLPRVFRSEGDMVEFDPSKIMNSIIKETGMTEEQAKHITELVVRRIIATGIQFLSGPHIREIVCSILSEEHFEEERKLYTRIGMPLMDYEELVERGNKEKPLKILNPEKIHHWAADRIAEEYAHLRILSNEESQAHLYGDIFIHNLKYFDLRPVSQIWDPRIILKFGLPPVSSWTHCCKSGPAGDLRVSINHLAKWLGMTQGEFSGTQGYNFINVFLAPYAKGLKSENIEQAMQSLIYEINQLSAVIGRDLPITTLSCSPKIPKVMENLTAYGPYGKEAGVYADYQEECTKIFDALTKVFSNGDYNGNPFDYPKHLVFIKQDWLEEYKENYNKIYHEIEKMNNPIFLNLDAPWLKKIINYDYSDKKFISLGTLQMISLNLPRYAIKAEAEIETFYELLEYNINLSAEVLKKKYEIVVKRLDSKHLPICSGIFNGNPLLKIEEQDLALCCVGLNEAVKILTENELHESKDSYNFGLKIVKRINDNCDKLSKQNNKKYVIHENISNKARFKFARLDVKHFSSKAIPLRKNNKIFYTNSHHFRYNIEMNPIEKALKQGQFHPLIQRGIMELINKKEITKISLSISEVIQQIISNKSIGCFKFS